MNVSRVALVTLSSYLDRNLQVYTYIRWTLIFALFKRYLQFPLSIVQLCIQITSIFLVAMVFLLAHGSARPAFSSKTHGTKLTPSVTLVFQSLHNAIDVSEQVPYQFQSSFYIYMLNNTSIQFYLEGRQSFQTPNYRIGYCCQG